jgi:hypothetical protein
MVAQTRIAHALIEPRVVMSFSESDPRYRVKPIALGNDDRRLPWSATAASLPSGHRPRDPKAHRKGSNG